MSSIITARLGGDVAPLRRDLQTAEQLGDASRRRDSEANKRAAAERKKQDEDAAKRRKELATRASQSANGLAGSLSQAENGTQALSAGLGAISSGLALTGA